MFVDACSLPLAPGSLPLAFDTTVGMYPICCTSAPNLQQSLQRHSSMKDVLESHQVVGP